MKIEFRVIHIFNDEKFVDSAISLFEEVYPDSSEYYVLQSQNQSFNHVRSERVKPLVISGEDSEQGLSDFLNGKDIEVVFLHALDSDKQRIADGLAQAVIKVWFIWGSDLYWNWKLLKKDMFEKETLQFMYGSDHKTSLKRKLVFIS